MIDRDSNRFGLYVQRALLRKARQHKGTDLGGFLKCAHDHLEATQGALNDALEALDEYREKEDWMMKENAEMRASLQAVRDAIQGIDKLCLPPADPFRTTPKDFSSHINVMAAHGVEPYSKRVKGWRSDKKSKSNAIPVMQFAIGVTE
jgi:hypothetical protein